MVPSQDGCVGYRVSMLDETGNDWLVRDDIGWVGCPADLALVLPNHVRNLDKADRLREGLSEWLQNGGFEAGLHPGL